MYKKIFFEGSGSLRFAYQLEAMTHGSPRPRNTFTELDPVTLPIAESAYSEPKAAVLLAKVSGRDVPRATIVMALTAAGIPRTHPNRLANYSTTPVIIPMRPRATTNAGHPP